MVNDELSIQSFLMLALLALTFHTLFTSIFPRKNSWVLASIIEFPAGFLRFEAGTISKNALGLHMGRRVGFQPWKTQPAKANHLNFVHCHF